MKTIATVAASSLLFLALAGTALAASVYTAPDGKMYQVPAGYAPYAYGIYYSGATGFYFNPLTGQTSTIVPAGPAETAPNGLPKIPFGYSSAAYGTYYAGSTGLYYDPLSGFLSHDAPVGPVYLGQGNPPNTQYNAAYTYNPGLPSTGAGGDATTTLSVLVFSAAIALLGTFHLTRRVAA